ncbi:carbon monoxide dehydrogenase subunit G [candidate division KSB1 bacterium]|nr:carbon monoxide dehydrogenase subunit G [candidate division KSB1 bacterium]
MKIEGSLTVAGTPEKLWDLLQDPEFLKEIMPGCKELKQTEEDHFTGIIEAKVGAISSRYTTKFSIYDKNRPNSYRLKVEGNGKGGFVNADTQVVLEANQDGTVMKYDGEVNIGGTIARIGQRLIDAASKMLIGKGIKNLTEKLEERLQESR